MSRIKVFINDRDKKNAIQILRESITAWRTKGEVPLYYFGKFLYRKNKANYADYLSQKQITVITKSKNLHRPEYSTLLRNKLSFSIFASRHNLPVPELVSYNLNHYFYYIGKKQVIKDLDGLIRFFEHVFQTSGKSSLFIKALVEMGGKDCFLLSRNSFRTDLEKYQKILLSGGFVHQECIIQHPAINKIYAASINTLRFDSYIDNQGSVQILSAFMRFGAGGSVVDNASSGGFYVHVDLQTGKLADYGHQLMKYGGREYAQHPDTGFVFGGFEIPLFKEACDLVKDAATHIPDRMIGWDIAIGPEAPIIIEGNDNNSIFMSDIAYGGYLKHPLFAEVLQEAEKLGR